MPITVSVYNHEDGQLVDEYVIDKESDWLKEIYLPNGKYDFYAKLPTETKNQKEQLRYYEYTREVNGKDFTVDFMEGSEFFIDKNESKLLGVETPSGTPYVTGSITKNEGKELAKKLAESQTGDSPDNEGYVKSEIDSKYDKYNERSKAVYNGEFYEGLDGSGKNFHEVELNNGDVNNLSEDINKDVDKIEPNNRDLDVEDNRSNELEESGNKKQENFKSAGNSKESKKISNKKIFIIIPSVLLILIILFLLFKNRR